MNERIRKLMGEAFDKAVPHTWSKLDFVEIEKLINAYTELVVKDCALTAGLMEQQGRKNIGAQILDNFGVAPNDRPEENTGRTNWIEP